VSLGQLPDHIGYALRRAQLAVFNDFITVLAQVDLRPGQFSVLVLEIERRGFTRRVAIDGRSKGLYLTPEGQAVTAQALHLTELHQARISAKIGAAECRHLGELLFRIADLDLPLDDEPRERP
jgi:hypothetical protein